MRLLVFTQKIDKNDSVLGFFHVWLESLSKNFEEVIAITLYEGEHNLPSNVKVHSLGKERGNTRIGYIKRFYYLIWKERKNYDSVFVHMNQEYVLLGGLIWGTLGKKIALWRNHAKGSFLTNIAVMLSDKVFCTSNLSYTAKFKKTKIMPVGVDTELFKENEIANRKERSICMVGRISEVKGIHIALSALKDVILKHPDVLVTFVGKEEEKDKKYAEKIRGYIEKENLSKNISFLGPCSQEKLPAIYNEHEVCLNLTEDGSFDKTIIEASLCGAIVLVSNKALKGDLPEESFTYRNSKDVAIGIERIFGLKEKKDLIDRLKKFANQHSLEKLIKNLSEEMAK